MGIIANYTSVTADELKKLQNMEVDTWDFLNNNENHIDIEKSWDILKYILTGSSGITGDVLDNIVPMSFENIVNDEDMGMGSAVYLDTQTVKEMSKEMEKISKEDFISKIDIEKIHANDILKGWSFEDIFNYSYSYFEILKDYFKKSAEESKYIVVWLD